MLSSQNGFKENQGRIGQPLIDSLSQKEPQWKLDGSKTSEVGDGTLYEHICALFERKIEDSSNNPKKRANFRDFNEYYNFVTSPHSRIRSFLDSQRCVGSLRNFKLFSLKKGDTEADQCKKSWEKDRSVFALTAEYLINREKRGVLASFFDLSLCSTRNDRLKIAKMTVFDYVEVSPGSEIGLGRLVRQEGYLIRQMKFYTGKEFFGKKE